MIEYAYFAFLLFFFVLGLIHGFEETEIDGKKARASPVFPALLLFVPFVFMLGFIVPGLGGIAATAMEPTTTTIRIQQTQNITAVVLTNKPNSGEVLTPLISWLYWAYVLAAALFPLGGYYVGYNLAAWLDERQTFPLLVRYPLVRLESGGKERKLVIYRSVEVPLPEEKVVVVGERPKKKKTAEDYVVLGAERWG